MAFCLKTPKWESRNSQNWDSHDFESQLWGLISLCANLRLQWALKQNCRPCRKLSNDMSHAAYTQGNRVDYKLLMVGNQTANLTSGLYLGHNLCFKCPNVSCEPILIIYVSIPFRSFGSMRDHSFTLSCILENMKCDSWASLLAHPFASPCLGCKPKARVTTCSINNSCSFSFMHTQFTKLRASL